MAKIINTESKNIQRAVKYLEEDSLVAFPTETVYGLGGNACRDHAVAKIFEAKGRPTFNPLIVHISKAEDAFDYACLSTDFQTLVKKFWPGPLTLIVKRKKSSPVSPLVSAGLDTLALRVPQHPIAQTLLRCFGGAIAAPSANLSERISPTTAEHVLANFQDKPEPKVVIDGGPCQVGLESTVLDVTDEPIILRLGTITQSCIENALGRRIKVLTETDRIKAPGQLKRHYAPALPLRLNANHVYPTEALIAFGSPYPHPQHKTFQLSERECCVEAAANLYKYLYLADSLPDITGIAVMPIPQEGLGAAINDRLRRAATK